MEEGRPPGIIRSGPPISLDMTAEGVERKGRRSGRFRTVYTRRKSQMVSARVWNVHTIRYQVI